MPKEVKISLTQSQIDFLKLDCSFPLFCGGYCSGKSHLMGFCALRDAMHSGDALIAIYEPDYNLIKTVAMPRIEYWLQEFGIKYKINHQDHVITTEPKHIGNFMFKSMDNPDTLIGYETYSSHLDELDTLSAAKAEKVWQKIMGRNRQGPKGVAEEHKRWSEENQRMECVNRMYAYSTPEGFKFCHKMWVLNTNPDFQLVKGKTEDNPKVSSAYLRQLRESYPSNLIEAYLNGEFVNLTSGTVYHCYDRQAHESYESIKPLETLYIGCDFNVGQMACTVYVRRNGGVDWHAVDEMSGLLDTPAIIQEIKKRYAGHPVIMYPDSSGANRHSSNGSAAISQIAQLSQAGFEIRAHSKNPQVIDRINATNKQFSDRHLFVKSSVCKQVTRCLEQQAYDKFGKPDKTSGVDHQNDATTYPIAYECAIRKPLFNINMKFMTKGDFE